MPDYRKILQQYWGYDDFRGIQRDIIESIGSGRDTLGLMPTGGGKSITFQVPTLAAAGLCLVVTPLIALMKDQVATLRAKGIAAAAIYSGQTHDDQLRQLDNCILGDYKFLYVSPERLASDFFQAKLRHMQVALIAVDEAHCISEWGYDFRPAYLQIASIRSLLPGVPVLALTATATPRVVDDIQAQLGFAQPNVFRMSFARKNLYYVVRQAEDKEAELLHILRSVAGSAIVYVRSRKGTTNLARRLQGEGITALDYHAGLTNDDKDLRQLTWKEGEARVMVATNAFGMGIDKANVRLVVHMDAPSSPEAYFQEAGRAGRDGHTAYAVMLWNRADRTKLLRRISETFPPKDFIRQIYDELAYYFEMAMGDGLDVTREFNLEEFCVNFKHFPTQTVSALQILARAGYIDYRDEDENKSRLMFLLQRDELYRLERTTPACEELMNAVLRTYAGVFSDYVYIEEKTLAMRTGLSQDQVYRLLKQLSQQHIIHYIPRKKVPHITYLTRRLPSSRLRIDAPVYENRREEFATRIHAMIDYAEASRCRSQLLLDYFGETGSSPCGHCDVCTQQHHARPEGDEELQEQIMARLADGAWHHPDDLRMAGISTNRTQRAVSALVAEEHIECRDGLLRRVAPAEPEQPEQPERR